METNKSIYKSKTLWTNLLLALPAIIDLCAQDNVFNIPQTYYAIAVLLVNVYLRSITKDPVTVRRKKNKKV